MCVLLSLDTEQTKVVVIQGDITDYSSVLAACRGADVVVHMASLVDVWHRVSDTLIHSVNVTGETPDKGLTTERMLRRCHVL